MRVPILGPADLLGAARSLGAAARTPGDVVSTAARLLPRVEKTFERAAGLPDAIEPQAPRVEAVLDDAATASPALA